MKKGSNEGFFLSKNLLNEAVLPTAYVPVEGRKVKNSPIGEKVIQKMDKLKVKIEAIAMVFVGLIVLIYGTSMASAATCDRIGGPGSICLSCTEGSMTGYNYNDYVIPSEAFTYSYFKGEQDAKQKLANWGYSLTCVRNYDGRDFTRAVSDGNRYQTHVAALWRNIDSSQGPEPNPQPPWCSNGNWGFALTYFWHEHCYEDCINSDYCTPGKGID